MTIRPAVEEDIPKIVELLKISLGESLLPKSEAYWRWKHLDNPFGGSYVLLAFDNDRLIGVRAFMCWKWKKGKEVLKSVRAVDTATHPNYQGQGIFRKLTLQLLNECQSKEVDIVFNTPNKQSKPGYLKMGWKEIGRLQIRIGFVRPIQFFLNIFKSQVLSLDVDEFNSNQIEVKKITSLTKFQNVETSDETSWYTPIDLHYLQWRYGSVPILNYYYCSENNNLVIFRIKQSRFGRELRILNSWGDNEGIELLIKTMNKRIRPNYISMEGLKNLKLPGINLRLKVGPIITIRKITTGHHKMSLTNWTVNLGDLELF